MAKVTLNDLSKALGLNEKEPKKDFHYYGTIVSSNPEDRTYEVSINRDQNVSVEAARLVGAAVGDTVMVTVMANGYATVTGRLGGDLDATDAQRAADNAADAASSAMGTASSALTNAQQANQAANAARTLAEHAEEEAGRAHTAAEQAAEDASSAATSASQAASSASSANTSAQNAAADASRAAASASSAETDAARASTAATNAESDAASAASNASRAATSASNAEANAASAATSAQNAANDASSAASSASSASTSASNAAASASTAQQQASAATTAANEAKAQATQATTAANEAKTQATQATTAANEAKASASRSNIYANAALNQLGIVEDVAGTLDWIAKHGTYTKTTDTTIDSEKVYFVYDSSTGDYTPVIDPKASELSTYYELDITESQGDFIMSHLAVTSRGLWVLPNGMGTASDPQNAPKYKALLAADGMWIYDDHGVMVAKYGDGISFDSTREYRIGDQNTYIRYIDSNNDGIADRIEIKAASISLGSTDLATKISNIEGQISSTDQDLANYITSQENVIEDLQNQIDGAIDTWYYSGDPTLSNQPAVAWTTDETKENHLRDLYFNTQNGHSFRFAKEGNTYKWIQIQDADAIKALADAAAAQGTANVKKRVFVAQPTPPYDIGDLWVQGSTGDIKRCATAKTSSQSFAAADWVLASKYTDDTTANAVDSALTNFKSEFTVTPAEISSEVQATKNGETLVSRINQTANTVKIEAEHVEIDGTATFNAIKSQADAAYDAKGAATDAENNAKAAIPTNVSQLTNDSGFQTASQVSTAVTNGVSGKADKTAAVAEEQYIYISKASGTTSVTGTTTWVTASSDSQNTWTTKRPTYSSSYPVLFIAKQKKTVSGTVTCTTPVKDDTTTIIDGGHITTGTIDTNRLNANTIKSNIVQTTELNADKITSGTLSADRIGANTLTLGKFDTTDQDKILNENLEATISGKAEQKDVTDLADQVFGEDETSIRNKLASLSDAIDDALLFVTDANNYMSFGGSLILGKADSDYDVNITNTQVQFRNNKTPIAYIDGQGLYVTNYLSFGSAGSLGAFQFIQRDNGHFTLRISNQEGGEI